MDVSIEQLIYSLTSRDMHSLSQPEIVLYLELSERMNNNPAELTDKVSSSYRAYLEDSQERMRGGEEQSYHFDWVSGEELHDALPSEPSDEEFLRYHSQSAWEKKREIFSNKPLHLEQKGNPERGQLTRSKTDCCSWFNFGLIRSCCTKTSSRKS